uniref:Endosulphine n=1 Tax=Triticum aestivum TaxID=4565 RepID=A0A077RYA9_WHEAT|nr:unnamed protein product [Triticum aestivum]
MSGMSSDDASAEVRPEGEVSGEKVEETQDQNEGSGMPSPQEEEAAIKKKYGGKMPKKSSLISKDHERAFFDSADWALGKQGGSPNKPKGPLEALRPKLQLLALQSMLSHSHCLKLDNMSFITHIIVGALICVLQAAWLRDHLEML